MRVFWYFSFRVTWCHKCNERAYFDKPLKLSNLHRVKQVFSGSRRIRLLQSATAVLLSSFGLPVLSTTDLSAVPVQLWTPTGLQPVQQRAVRAVPTAILSTRPPPAHVRLSEFAGLRRCQRVPPSAGLSQSWSSAH